MFPNLGILKSDFPTGDFSITKVVQIVRLAVSHRTYSSGSDGHVFKKYKS